MTPSRIITFIFVTLCLVLCVINKVETRRSGGGSRVSSGGSRTSSWGGGSRGSSSSSWGGGSSSSHRATNNWSKAKDRVSSQPKPQAQPRPQPNPEHHQLSYGHNEPAPNSRPVSTNANQPKPQPNAENTRLSYAPSAPSMETGHAGASQKTVSNQHAPSAPPMETGHHVGGSQMSNKQTVSNQHSPSVPPMDHSGHQQPAGAARPIGWNVGGQQPNTHGGLSTGTNVNKPIGFDNVNKQATPGVGGQPHATNTHVNPNQNYPGYNQPGYHPQNGYNQPGQPGYHPQTGYNQPGYHPQGGYNQPGYHSQYPQQGYYGHPQGGYGGYGGHNYNYGGYHGGAGYSSFGGYNPPGSNIHYGPVTYINGHSTPQYSYFHDRSDNSLLSFFVGYQVAKMFSYTPSSYFHGNTYTVHHYHHDKQTVPEKVTVQANTIIACAENITLLCLANSYPVCMSNGTIMCVTNPQLTIQCKDNNNLQCISSTIDCNNNNTSPICHDKNVTLSAQNTTTLSIPCVSSVSIYGDLSLLQNVINSTLPANGSFNVSSTTPATVNLTMVTDGTNGTIITTISDESNTTITTTPVSTTITSNPPAGVTNIFCVTVIAVPAPLNQTAFKNVTAQATVQYATPLADPVVQEKMWNFFGDVLDHIFG